MSYSMVSIAGKSYAPKNILMSDVMDIAKMPSAHFERQLSRVLMTISDNKVDVLKLTCEERYAIFLHYLDITRDHNDLGITINPNDYLAGNLDDFTHERKQNDNGVSVRHLLGVEAEALENGCENTSDWIIGEMAMTIGCELLPPLDMATTVKFTENMISSRSATLLSMDTIEFNALMDQYLDLQQQQKHLVNIAFDGSIVLEKINLRGADAAPVRFRPSIAFKGYCKELLSIAIGKNTSI